MNDYTDHQKLSAWLYEWQLDRMMTDAADTPTAGEIDAALLPPATQEATVRGGVSFRRGDILLIKPLTALTRSRPVYVIILGNGGRVGRRQVVPFARFSTPATPSEISTGLEPPPLRVLCWWNRYMVSAIWLQASAWRVCRLTPERVQAMFAPDDKRRGPHLIHPLDPRHAYLDTERALWEELAPALAHWEYTNGASGPKSATDIGWEQARAAENPDDEYGCGSEP